MDSTHSVLPLHQPESPRMHISHCCSFECLGSVWPFGDASPLRRLPLPHWQGLEPGGQYALAARLLLQNNRSPALHCTDRRLLALSRQHCERPTSALPAFARSAIWPSCTQFFSVFLFLVQTVDCKRLSIEVLLPFFQNFDRSLALSLPLNSIVYVLVSPNHDRASVNCSSFGSIQVIW